MFLMMYNTCLSLSIQSNEPFEEKKIVYRVMTTICSSVFTNGQYVPLDVVLPKKIILILIKTNTETCIPDIFRQSSDKTKIKRKLFSGIQFL